MKKLFLAGFVLVLSACVLAGVSFARIASPTEPSKGNPDRGGLPLGVSTRQSAYIATVTPTYVSQADRLSRYDFLPKILRQENSR
ncbi:MAG: hypothetical protein COW11_00500 [Candidatus Omnitrophica bacterium CG12_big_fil_rev_8_21_14_0_65_43_15]|uniref:Uncharacterized protein n=1 Tax=Candidatus Taenaricola geysiri TaxID=1974752 RepID=A0A2J0LLN4_9BACT|nr:MAG: hypothetical protein COS48_03980 [Candidatus Omnitrophica bacterium CG03_land_8_20_14_0_80_43_22]PIW66960.1 MAG: hypothetical protein COW11_00500 [Candidatus Omnitrophica bacterium CG12_big_fil_rev_8_21_14_0_65_43_15]PIY85000.1 MAG: hypothetical protein COY77_00010 [Candidatus Omnitrophica bacterium CG_4_10_14_0_8_um_filter_43_18]